MNPTGLTHVGPPWKELRTKLSKPPLGSQGGNPFGPHMGVLAVLDRNLMFPLSSSLFSSSIGFLQCSRQGHFFPQASNDILAYRWRISEMFLLTRI